MIDDTFWAWARLIEVLDAVGQVAEASAATAQAQARVQSLAATLPDDALRASLVRDEPVATILARASRSTRETAGATPPQSE